MSRARNRSTEMKTLTSPAWRRAHLLWIGAITTLVFVMVGIGGITRLTGSGLSITDWAPFMGAIPPLSGSDWQAVFAKYQASPQYQKVNHGMTLPEFKFIFFWEYIHRLIGRMIGVVVLVPGLWFWSKKALSRPLRNRVFIGFCLGGLQGFIGWFMVKSGLIDRPSVSHFRLASHLLLALFILAYFVWLFRAVMTENQAGPRSLVSHDEHARVRFWSRTFSLLLGVQILYGAFVAGLKAGFTFNTFPLMNGEWIPDALLLLQPTWLNLFENPATIQWLHRYLGKIVFVTAVILWSQARKVPALRTTAHLILAGVFLQFALGVLTLVHAVPLSLGVIHQFGAAVLVALATILAHQLMTHTPMALQPASAKRSVENLDPANHH